MSRFLDNPYLIVPKYLTASLDWQGYCNYKFVAFGNSRQCAFKPRSFVLKRFPFTVLDKLIEWTKTNLDDATRELLLQASREWVMKIFPYVSQWTYTLRTTWSTLYEFRRNNWWFKEAFWELIKANTFATTKKPIQILIDLDLEDNERAPFLILPNVLADPASLSRLRPYLENHPQTTRIMFSFLESLFLRPGKDSLDALVEMKEIHRPFYDCLTEVQLQTENTKAISRVLEKHHPSIGHSASPIHHEQVKKTIIHLLYLRQNRRISPATFCTRIKMNIHVDDIEMHHFLIREILKAQQHNCLKPMVKHFCVDSRVVEALKAATVPSSADRRQRVTEQFEVPSHVSTKIVTDHKHFRAMLDYLADRKRQIVVVGHRLSGLDKQLSTVQVGTAHRIFIVDTTLGAFRQSQWDALSELINEMDLVLGTSTIHRTLNMPEFAKVTTKGVNVVELLRRLQKLDVLPKSRTKVTKMQQVAQVIFNRFFDDAMKLCDFSRRPLVESGWRFLTTSAYLPLASFFEMEIRFTASEQQGTLRDFVKRPLEVIEEERTETPEVPTKMAKIS